MSKKVIVTFILSAMVLGMTSCGEVDESVKAADISSASSVSSESPAAETTGDFDWDTAMDNLYMSGHKIEIPFSLNSLKKQDENFYIEDSETSFYEITDGVVGRIFYDDTELCCAYFYGVDLNTYTDDLHAEELDRILDFNIQGITKESTLSDLIHVFGEPNERNETPVYNDLIYYGEGNSKIELVYDDENDKIKSLRICIS